MQEENENKVVPISSHSLICPFAWFHLIYYFKPHPRIPNSYCYIIHRAYQFPFPAVGVLVVLFIVALSLPGWCFYMLYALPP